MDYTEGQVKIGSVKMGIARDVVASWLVRLRIERSGIEPWPGTLCCFLWQDS